MFINKKCEYLFNNTNLLPFELWNRISCEWVRMIQLEALREAIMAVYKHNCRTQPPLSYKYTQKKDCENQLVACESVSRFVFWSKRGKVIGHPEYDAFDFPEHYLEDETDGTPFSVNWDDMCSFNEDFVYYRRLCGPKKGYAEFFKNYAIEFKNNWKGSRDRYYRLQDRFYDDEEWVTFALYVDKLPQGYEEVDYKYIWKTLYSKCLS